MAGRGEESWRFFGGGSVYAGSMINSRCLFSRRACFVACKLFLFKKRYETGNIVDDREDAFEELLPKKTDVESFLEFLDWKKET